MLALAQTSPTGGDTPMRETLTGLDYLVLAIYMGGLFLLGIVTSGRQTSEEQYFLSGRKTPSWLAGISVVATLLSTLTFVSLPGEMIAHGVGLFTSVFAVIAATIVVSRLIIPVLMRLPVTSVYDYLERRFGLSARSMGAAVFVATRLIWIGLIIYTASFAVATMTHWDIRWTILVIGLITTFYTMLGGMQAVLWSDFAQFIILAGGTLAVPIVVWLKTDTGPVVWWEAFASTGRASAPIFSLDPTQRLNIVGVLLFSFLWHLCTHGSDQVAAQRYLSTDSPETARRSLWVFCVGDIGMVLLLMTCGLALFHYDFTRSGMPLETYSTEVRAVHGDSTAADQVLPKFIVNVMPSGLSGLLVAALLAAAMSSLSSGINSITTVIVTDGVERFGVVRRGGQSLRLAKILAAVIGLIGIGLAMIVAAMMRGSNWNIVDLMERVNHLFVAPLGALFLVGILSGRTGLVPALLGFWAGVASGVLVAFSPQIFDLNISFMWIMPLGFVISLGTMLLLAPLFPRPTPKQLEALRAGSSSS